MNKKLVIDLEVIERNALLAMAVLEHRSTNSQAAFIIRRELERLGYLEPQSHGRQDAAEAPAFLTEPSR